MMAAGPYHHHHVGRIVATPMLDRSQEFLGHAFIGHSYRMDAHRLEAGKGSLRYRPKPSHMANAAFRICHDHRNSAAGWTAQLADISSSPHTSGVRLDVFLYQESDLNLPIDEGSAVHLELNRQADEPVTRTLQRLGLNIQKKLDQFKKTHLKKSKPNMKKISSSDPVVWKHDIFFHQDPMETVAIDISTMTNVDFCQTILSTTEPIFTVELFLGGLGEDGEMKTMRFTVDACVPTVMSVKTYEDFGVRLFSGIPLTLAVETLYATHSQVDWYVDSFLHKTTIERNGLHSYLPSAEEHIGKRLSVMVKAFRMDEANSQLVHDGNGTEHAFQFHGLIEARPTTTILDLRQQWLQEQRHYKFRFLTYNILADQNAFSMFDGSPYFPYVSKETLDKRRRLPLVLHEIISYCSDVVCLQEVDESVFDSLLLPTFQSLGYQGFYSGKVKDGTKEGCATFWSTSTFLSVEKIDQLSYSIRDLVSIVENTSDDDYRESDEPIATLLRDSPDLRHILSERLGHVFQLVPLRLRDDSNTSTIWVVNTHLFYHPLASHIRLLQAYLLSRQVGKILSRHPGDLIVTGDFNSSLRNVAGKLLLDRCVPKNFHETKEMLKLFKWEKDSEEGNDEPDLDASRDFPSVRLPEDFPILQSAIVPEPQFTHYVAGFCGNLDHILLSKKYQCASYAPMPTEADVTTEVAMPSSVIHSDHVCVVCDIKYHNQPLN